MRKYAFASLAVVLVLAISTGTVYLRAQAKSAADDKAAIKALYDHYNEAFIKKDVNGIMSVYGPSLFAFDAVPPREYPTWDAYKKDWEGLLTAYPGPVTSSIQELNITVVGSVAYTHYVDDGSFSAKDGTKEHLVVRTTDVLRKTNGKWLIVQEHVSFPVDLTTGKADLLSNR